MLVTKSAVHAMAMFMVALVALFAAYPWSVYHDNFSFPWQRTLLSYLALAALTTVASSVVPLRVVHEVMARHLGEGHLTMVAIFIGASGVGLFALALTFGGVGLGLEVPGTRIRGIFFSEWKFATFLLWVGAPTCAIGAALMLAIRVYSRWK